MLLNARDFGEQTLNRIAQLALQSQFKHARSLQVRVNTDPTLLSQGRLESLTIEVTEFVTRNYQSVQAMQIEMKDIAVNPFKALMGDIRLTEPSCGTAQFVLSQTDLGRIWVAKSFQEALGRWSGEIVPESLHCRLLAGGMLALAVQRRSHPAPGETVEIFATPSLDEAGHLSFVVAPGESPLPPQFARFCLDAIATSVSSSSFEMPGLALHLRDVRIEEGQLTLQATARMTHFPTKR